MICLGIESTAHTFGVGIVDDKGKALANERASFTTKEGGIKPREAFDHHVREAPGVVRKAMDNAGIGWKEIGLVSFARGPGIGPCLTAGAIVSRTLSLLHNKPLLGVNHCVAHIEIGRLVTKSKDPIVLYTSGANTQVIGYESGKYRIYGETLDMGVGNLLDSFGREMGLGFPAGPAIDRMYFDGKKYIELPYSVKGMDLAFSGLFTAASKKIGKAGKEDLAYSLMHTAFAMLAEVTERALAHTGKKEVLVVGGVAASKALKEIMGEMCRARGAKLHIPPMEVCIDNGVMVAWQGLLEHRHGRRMNFEEMVTDQRFRTDQVDVNWLKP